MSDYSDLCCELAVLRHEHQKLLAALEEKDRQLARYSISPGQADQRLCESRAVREILGFPADSAEVSPADLKGAIEVLKESITERNELIAELEQRLQQPSKEGKELFAEISSECVVDNDNFVGYLVKDESMDNLERLLTGSLPLPITLTLPTTRYWHGPLATYEKSDVIACINAAAKSSNVIIKVEGE